MYVNPGEATNATLASVLNDCNTKKFFSTVQLRLGRRLEKLDISCCCLVWQRPSSTSASLIRHLRKCVKLVSVELNFVKFHVADLKAHKLSSAEQEEPVHWLLESIVSGCPFLEVLGFNGTKLTALQSYNLGLKIERKWKGSLLQIHTRHSSQSSLEEDVIYSLIQALKSSSKFRTVYNGGYRGTILIRRKKHLCGLFQNLRSIPQQFSLRRKNSGDMEENDASEDGIQHLRSTLSSGQRSIFGLTPFDYSIMLAHKKLYFKF